MCPEEAKELLLTSYITKEGYHGGDLEGGQADKLLKNIDKLEEKIPDEHKSIIDGFKATKLLNLSVAKDWKTILRKPLKNSKKI